MHIPYFELQDIHTPIAERLPLSNELTYPGPTGKPKRNKKLQKIAKQSRRKNR